MVAVARETHRLVVNLNERKKKWRDRESGKPREMEGREGDRERKRKEREMGERAQG